MTKFIGILMAGDNIKIPTVFVSYAHESDAFRAKIKALCDWLRGEGVEVVCDFDYEIRPPPKGWTTWMQHGIEDAAVVLVVASPKYKARFEKRTEPEAGKGVAWEGAIITQDLYGSAQRNDKFYPIIPDDGGFDDVPKALTPWNNNHRFPSGQSGIHKLIQACTNLIVVRTTSLKPVTPNTLSDRPITPQPLTVTEVTTVRSAVLSFLNQSNFLWLNGKLFTADGMPTVIDATFRAATENVATSSKSKTATDCIEAIIRFAGQVVDAAVGADAASPIRIATHRNAVLQRLISAMQLMLLFGANPTKLPIGGIDAAFRTADHLTLDMMFSELVSVVLRPALGEHLHATVEVGKRTKIFDKNLLAFDGIETGPMRDEKYDPAKIAVMKKVSAHMFPGEPAFPDKPTEKEYQALLGKTKGLKNTGRPLFTVYEANDAPGDYSVRWFKDVLNIGTVTVSGNMGTFEIGENEMLDALERLMETLHPITINK